MFINKMQTNIELTSLLLILGSPLLLQYKSTKEFPLTLAFTVDTKRFHISTSSMQPALPDVSMAMVRGCIYSNIALNFGRGRRPSPCSRPLRRAKPTS
jgi:hypothetical protein